MAMFAWLPIAAGAIRLATALVFLQAALHKWREGDRFAGIVADYRLLPSAWAGPVAAMLPWLELGAAASLCWPQPLAVVPAALLLCAMTAAVAINLLRGRVRIECGCGVARGQRLSVGLLLRNVLHLLMLAAAALPNAILPLAFADAVLLAAAAATAATLYFAATQLLANAAAWREMTVPR